MLGDISFQNATGSFDKDTYIGVNATQKSMNGVRPDIVSLDEVPGYQLALQCFTKPVPVSQVLVLMDVDKVTILLTLDSEISSYNALYPSQTGLWNGTYYENDGIVCFAESDATNAYVGFLDTLIYYNQDPISTP
jgi:hypothetical protein